MMIRKVLNSPYWDWLFRLLILVGIVAFVANYTGDRRHAEELQTFVACQQEYNKVNNDRTRAITEASRAEREAERKSDDAQSALWLDPAIAASDRIRPSEWITIFNDIAAGTFTVADAEKFSERLLQSDSTPEDRARILKKFKDFQTSLTDLKEERKLADEEREKNPVPPPPEDLCGTVPGEDKKKD